MSVPHNIVMGLNNVIYKRYCYKIINENTTMMCEKKSYIDFGYNFFVKLKRFLLCYLGAI